MYFYLCMKIYLIIIIIIIEDPFKDLHGRGEWFKMIWLTEYCAYSEGLRLVLRLIFVSVTFQFHFFQPDSWVDPVVQRQRIHICDHHHPQEAPTETGARRRLLRHQLSPREYLQQTSAKTQTMSWKKVFYSGATTN